MHVKIVVCLLPALLVFGSCKDDSPPADEKSPCPPFLTVPTPPYSGPIWHPSGQFIGFNHVPETSITYPYGEHCQGEQHFNTDSMGFWLINPDGTNMRRILPYPLLGAAWSPDGQQIAWGAKSPIFKMPFGGSGFDTANIQNLWPAGYSAFPEWSPDGEWLAFNFIGLNGQYGLFVVTAEGTDPRLIDRYGIYPDWHPISLWALIYMTSAISSAGQALGDSLWRAYVGGPKELIRFLSGSNFNNRFPRYSPDGSKIAFWSQPPAGINGNLWVMNADGTDLQELTVGGADVDFGTAFSWSPDGSKIVYTRYHDRWTYDNGTLWILNIATGISTQLTFNGTQPFNRGGDSL